jgi:hypothetical protein
MADNQPTIGNFRFAEGEADGTKTKTLTFHLPAGLKPAAQCSLTFDSESDENRVAKTAGILTSDKNILFPGGGGTGPVPGWSFQPNFNNPCTNPAGIHECELFGELTGNWTGEYTKCRIKFTYNPNCDPHINLTTYSADSPCTDPNQYGPLVLRKSYFYMDVSSAKKYGFGDPRIIDAYIDGEANATIDYGPGSVQANQSAPLSCDLECLSTGAYGYIKLVGGNPAVGNKVEGIRVQYGPLGPIYAFVRESYTGATFMGLEIMGKIVEADAVEIFGTYNSEANGGGVLHACDFFTAYPENYYSLGYYLDKSLTASADSAIVSCTPPPDPVGFSGSDSGSDGFEICEGGNMVAGWINRDFDVTIEESITISGKKGFNDFTATFDISVNLAKAACDVNPTHVISCSCSGETTVTCTYDGGYTPVEVQIGEVTFECSNRKINIFATPDVTETFPGSRSVRGFVRVQARLASV